MSLPEKFESVQRGNYRISLRLDSTMDADLIAWLENAPKGKRSDALGSMMREHLKAIFAENRHDVASPDLEAIRTVIADELRKALQDTQSMGVSSLPKPEKHDMESKYGDKLNRMLGGFTNHQHESS
jgi:hypothetical protein